MVSNGFVQNEELENPIFTPGITRINTPAFNMLVIPDQLQFNDNGNPTFSYGESLQKTLIPMISQLTEIPYKALGLNIVWFVSDSEKSTKILSKEMFYINGTPLYENFKTDDARFGSYMSKNYDQSRLKLDIKPVTLQNNEEVIQFAFNFHIDLTSGNCSQLLKESLNKWSNYFEEANRITDLLK